MGYKIKEIREAQRLTQEELAEKSGVSRATISAMENGVDRNTASKTLLRLARALGVTIDQIFCAESVNRSNTLAINGHFELMEHGKGYCGQQFSSTDELIELLERYAKDTVQIHVLVELPQEYTGDAQSGDGA